MSQNTLPETMTLVRDNILELKSPLGLSAKENAAWAADLALPKQGELLFYTGGEYQLLPFIDSLMGVMKYIDPGSQAFSWLMGLRDLVHKTGLVPEKIFASIFAADKDRYFAINRKAATILLRLGYELAYDGEHEIYSGALLHEMGYGEALGLYGTEVARYLRRTDAREVVCLSPHAAEMFKYVYAKNKDFPKIEVKTFAELVWARRDRLPQLEGAAPFVIHDSCRLAREMDVVTELRDILDALGVEHRDPERSGAWTTCCGGPVKMTYPDLAKKLAKQRVDELTATGASQAVVACPFCLSALAGVSPALSVIDLVELIGEAYGL